VLGTSVQGITTSPVRRIGSRESPGSDLLGGDQIDALRSFFMARFLAAIAFFFFFTEGFS